MAIQKSSRTDNGYSPEVNEILGLVPPKLIRTGITFLFLLLVIFLTGSYFFRYPVIVSAKVVLTTINSPAPLVAKIGGRIDTWFVSDGEIVRPGSPIALLQSTAKYEDIILVQSRMQTLTGNWEHDSQHARFTQDVVLGDVQGAYLNFYSNFSRYKFYIQESPLLEKIRSQNELIRLYREQYEIGLKQKRIKDAKFQIAAKFFAQDSLLFEQNKFGIPKREFDASAAAFLQEKENLLAFDASLKNMETSIFQSQNSISELRAEHFQTTNDYERSIDESKKLLESQILAWRDNYLLVSPILGTVTFTNFWSSNQVITSGQRLATVIPLEKSVIVGRAFISSSELGQVEEGQPVNIKLAGFPFLKYGTIKGNVRTISLVPEEAGYVVEIELSTGMVSSFSERLKFVHEMDGVAEIVVKESSFLFRLLGI